MDHLPKLIIDLALILLVGSVVAILFRRIKQPLVLGYIIAGFLVGPHFTLIPTVVDKANIETFAELGVIMLLFSLGLEFSFKKLMKVGGAASITAVVEILFVGLGGYLVGYLLGWNSMDSLFLGGMLASSSTTIIIKAFDELKLKTKHFARVVFGVLVVEDIIVILLMVLLSTVAVTKKFEGAEIIFTVLKLGFFLVLWFLVGIYLLPSFLKKAKQWMDEEILLLLSIGLNLGMVLLATEVGFSAELGAFVMGSLIAETTLAEKVEHLTLPIKQLFGTIFFVSVGMMIDPNAMVTYAVPIIVITLFTLVGKFFFSSVGALASGQPLKQSIQVGMSMAQIGEFAFIVATLGLSLGVISEFLFPVAVGVSAITTFTTPYMIKMSEPFYNLILKSLPSKWVERIENYSSDSEKIQTDITFMRLVQEFMRIIIVNSIILIAIILLFRFFVTPFVSARVDNEWLHNGIILALALAVSAPFLWAVVIKRPNILNDDKLSEEFTKSGAAIALLIVRFLLGVFLAGFFIDQIVSTKLALIASVPIIIAFLYIFRKQFQTVYARIESRFVSNLNARESEAYMQNKKAVDLKTKNDEMKAKMKSWNAHIIELELGPDINFAGNKLEVLKWKERYGINVVYIKRGDRIIHLPGKDHVLFPKDKLGVLGTDEQVTTLKTELDSLKLEDVADEELDVNDIKLHQVHVEEYNPYIGKSIRLSGIREDFNCHVVGIERDGERIFNPDSSEIITINDTLWLVGISQKIKSFIKQQAGRQTA